MKRLHQAVGVLTLIIFILTGQYLRRYYHMDEMEDGMRMLLRSRHLYIMLAGALNLGIGLYFTARPPGWRKVVQLIGSVLILIAPVLLIIAFFREPQLGIRQAQLAPLGLYAVFGGIVLHFISGVRQSREAAQSL